MDLPIPEVDLVAALPVLGPAVGAMVLLLLVGAGVLRHLHHAAWATAAVLVASGAAVLTSLDPADARPFTGMLTADGLGLFVTGLCLVAALVTTAVSPGYLRREGDTAEEYFVLLVFAVAGMAVLATGTDLIALFLGLEIMSLSVYVLAGAARGSSRSAEASIKYFLLGAFSSAILLYGIAFAYGAAGSTGLEALAEALSDGSLATRRLASVGAALLLAGTAFKVAAVPFHLWTPDVYEGAPTPITAFMAVAVKAAAFAFALRVVRLGMGTAPEVWTEALWWLASATMIVGNLSALVQTNLKRMLAYSSIGHAGYLLVALVAGAPGGATAILFYLAAYGVATLGAFAVLAAVGERGEGNLTLDEIAGLARTRPGAAAALALFLLSLAGIPPTAGFFGKLLIFTAALEAGLPSLAILLALTSAISLGYYLVVIVRMYMADPARVYMLSPAGAANHLVVGAAVIAALALGILPGDLLELAEQAALPLP